MTAISTPPHARHIEAVRIGQGRLFQEPTAVGGLTLVVGLRLGPLDVSETMRAEIGKLMNVPNLRGHSAIVIESEGFASATVRALLGALILLSRTESPQKMFETRALAADYLAQHAPAGWRPEDLLEAAATFTEGLAKKR
ncbi:MAG: hypothetical protein JNK04_04520 [Myxococcales bacterium]|nr:hypothetical protein [Myxococcales bacterium]